MVIWSTTQLIQSEGQRATNLALELSKLDIPVVFAAWTWEATPWSHQDRLSEGILQVPLDQLTKYPDELFDSFSTAECILIAEFPHPDFLPLIAAANARAWVTIYDVIDDWDGFRRMGQAPWYDESSEQALAASADMVVCVNRNLARKLNSFGRDDYLLLPNGFVEGMDLVSEAMSLPRGDVTIGYWGHLTSSWLDWDLIRDIARQEPRWSIYIAGYGDNFQPTALPPNVILLGKVPQRGLAAIAQNLDVGIVPFLPGSLSEGADVIKIYEYLAMGLPVVVTGVYPPEGASDYVLRAGDNSEFHAMVKTAAANAAIGVDERTAFGRSRTWGSRLTALLEAIDQGDQRVAQKRWLFRETA
jgi:glycosyltransferase involved in cell wall biosynthesis